MEIEGVNSETEGVLSENEGVDNEVLPPDRKGYSLRNPPNVNYCDKRATWIFMVWYNLIVGSNELHSVAKVYFNVVNTITNFFKSTPPTNIITNKTIIFQYSINQILNIFGNKGVAALHN